MLRDVFHACCFCVARHCHVGRVEIIGGVHTMVRSGPSLGAAGAAFLEFFLRLAGCVGKLVVSACCCVDRLLVLMMRVSVAF